MADDQFDIVISGGGPAGLTAAAALANAGFKLLLVDPTAPTTRGDAATSDLRSTAFLQPARDLFQTAGVWDRLSGAAVPLRALRIVDTVGTPPTIRDERAFLPSELGADVFGWNFLNWVIRRELVAHLQAQGRVTLKFGTGFKSMLRRTSGAIVSLTDGTRVRARLVVGADGRDSAVREAAGIGVSTTRYGQKSLAFTATHERPHENISTEIYHEGGPFTMVPLDDIDGKPASAIVWMNQGKRAHDLLKMEPAQFNAEMTERAAGLSGNMELASRRGMFPIISQRAERLTAQHCAIIAEAAHVLPPIGAQGLNTSLNDVAALLEAAVTHRDELGGERMLASYEHARARDISRRARAIDLFNRVTRSGNPGLQSLRLAGLKAAHDMAPVRRSLMRAGMGPDATH